MLNAPKITPRDSELVRLEIQEIRAQAARFALLISDYLCKATKLPPEFGKLADDRLLPLQPVK
jgi:hypothetical protein